MSLPERVYVGRHRTTANGQAQLTGVLLGAASGMGINTFSDDVGYPGTVGMLALAATVTAAMWLRQRPRARVTRYGTRLLLTLAFGAGFVSAFGPGSSSAAACLVAVALALTAAAILVPTDVMTAGSLLGGTGLIAVGVAGLGDALSILRETPPPGSALEVPLAVPVSIGILALAAALGGTAVLRASRSLGSAAFLIGGVAWVVDGVALSRIGWAAGPAIVVLGLAGLLGGVAVLRGGDTWRGAAVAGGGAAYFLLGAVNVYSGLVFYGIASVAGGLVATAAGLSLMAGAGLWRLLLAATGFAAVVSSADPLLSGKPLFGLGNIAVGVAVMAVTLAAVYRDDAPRIRTWLHDWTTEPGTLQTTRTGGP